MFLEGILDASHLQKIINGFPKVDNLMEEGSNNKCMLDLFTKQSHHRNIAVVYLCQDVPSWQICQEHLAQHA